MHAAYELPSGLLHLRTTLVTAFIASLALFRLKLFKACLSFRQLQKMGLVRSSPLLTLPDCCIHTTFPDVRRPEVGKLRLIILQPIAPHHGFFFGHMLLVKDVMSMLLRDSDIILTMSEICRRFIPQQGICYLDMWLLSDTLVLVSSPALAQQAAHTNPALATERPSEVRDYLHPIAGGPNHLDLPETELKPQCAVMNKSFGAAHVLSLVPDIVAECLVFRQTLLGYTQRGELCFLNITTLRLTSTFVGHLIL
jgi:hypothetical protein